MDSDSLKLPENSDKDDEYEGNVTESDDENDPSAAILVDRECRCGTGYHPRVLIIDSVYRMDLKYLFECLFAENAFSTEYRNNRKLTLKEMTDWVEVVPEDKRTTTRCLKYSVLSNLKILGSVAIHSTEKQVCHRIREDAITVDSELHNSNVPYSDRFYVLTKYCLTKLGSDRTALRICSEVKFIKSIWALTRGVIERNTVQALQDSFQALDQRLHAECHDAIRDHHRQINQNDRTLVNSRCDSMLDDGEHKNVSNNHLMTHALNTQWSICKGAWSQISITKIRLSHLCAIMLLVLFIMNLNMFSKLRDIQSTTSSAFAKEHHSTCSSASELAAELSRLSVEIRKYARSKLKVSESGLYELARTLDDALRTMSDIGNQIVKSVDTIRSNFSRTIDYQQQVLEM
ncbi:hypothetical protein ACOME3_009815 [Neoechinorhynchus agilis]